MQFKLEHPSSSAATSRCQELSLCPSSAKRIALAHFNASSCCHKQKEYKTFSTEVQPAKPSSAGGL